MSSRIAGIDFQFRDPLTASGIVHALFPFGWGLPEPLGISYALADATGDLEWTSVPEENTRQVLAMLDAPEHSSEGVGWCMYHAQAGTGGQLLLPATRSALSFTPTINRRPHPIGHDLTDLSWYLTALLPGLTTIGLTGYEAEDIGF